MHLKNTILECVYVYNKACNLYSPTNIMPNKSRSPPSNFSETSTSGCLPNTLVNTFTRIDHKTKLRWESLSDPPLNQMSQTVRPNRASKVPSREFTPSRRQDYHGLASSVCAASASPFRYLLRESASRHPYEYSTLAYVYHTVAVVDCIPCRISYQTKLVRHAYHTIGP